MENFFDFHLHVALKPQFNDEPKRDTPWYEFKLGKGDLVGIVNSQSCAAQLVEGKYGLVGIALHVPESNMAKGLSQLLERNDPISHLIKKLFAKILARILEKVSENRLAEIQSGKHNFQLLKEELKNITDHLQSPASGNGISRTLRLVETPKDVGAFVENSVAGFLTVEGVHCFFGSEPIGNPEGEKQMMDNIDELAAAHRLFAINIAHLQCNDICNHAFGIKIFKDQDFYPKGDGIKDGIGQRTIAKIYGKGILIDLKHTSAKARKQLYDLRNEHPEWQHLPLISTHTGVTGTPRIRAKNNMAANHYRPNADDMLEVTYNKKPGYLENTAFNACSINLYDEDIVAILDSGGIIGISLDKRILGYVDSYGDESGYIDKEFLSKPEFEYLFDGQTHFTLNIDEGTILTEIPADALQNTVLLHLRYFFNQLFHILEVALDYDLQDAAVKGICLGSDFDGLIDALDCCPTASDIRNFYKLAQQHAADYLDEAMDNGFKNVYGNFHQLLDRIFITNGAEFVRARLG